MKQKEIDASLTAGDLNAGLAEIHELLARLCKGDTALHASVHSGDDICNTLKIMINQLAEYIQETTEYAHEMAIGLCEHYETLNRIASGDFSARAPVNSRNEMIAKLGELINKESETLTGAISVAKKAEADSRNAYQQMLDIIEFLPDATFVVDREKRVIAWNRAIEKMTGLNKGDVIGKGEYLYAIPFYGERRPILIDLIDEDVDVVRKKYDYIKVEGRTLFAETYIPSFRNGPPCYLWGTATPLFDSQGNQVGGIESIRDITEYKRFEEEKIRLESRLDHARLMETVMIRLGHDLRTPLTPLFILLPMLKKKLGEPSLIKKVDMCIKSVVSIKNLADKTRILAGLSTGVKAYERESVLLAPIVDQALSECAGMILQKQLGCRNRIDPDLLVHAVPAQLNELFCNLISNAAQYSYEKGDIVITAEQHGENAVISVRDEGVGLDPEHLEHVFDEFFKADESRHDLDASGLGLTICKRIVQNHHGRIWAESSGIGTGTTIKFTM